MQTTPKRVRAAPVEVFDKKRIAYAKATRASLFQRCRAACDQLGDEVVGFALVVWDQHGDMRTAYDAARGPIGPALVPTLASDALNRHVAVKLAEERLSDSR